MTDLPTRKEGFLRDPLPRRLGNLASSLNRIALIPTSTGRAAMVDECKHFIEWTAADTEPETAEELVEIQRQLPRFEDKLEQPDQLQTLKNRAKEWSNRVLQHSGLLEEK
ncbi:MAG: hypothetical protein IVW51_01230 [Thermaceae bacterium]|nr:hypothetical protein [Thermaceae bacterium]